VPTLTSAERVGTTLAGKYRLDRILGAGGMGTVFAGMHAWTGREVLVLRGDGGRDEFAGYLRAAGAVVRFTQAYHRGPARLSATEQALLASAIARPARHLWWLSSAEAVGYLPQLAAQADWRDACALASHPRIAARAREVGFGLVFEAPPTLDAVQAALVRIEACLQSLPP